MATFLGQDIKRTQWVAESTFAVTPTTALQYLGEVFELTGDYNPNPEEDQIENRAFTDVDFTNYEVGFGMKAKVRKTEGGWNLVNFWALYALGAVNGRASTGLLGSFSLVSKKSNAGATHYHLYNGCKCDGITINSPGVAKSLIFSMTARCQYMERSTTKAFSQLQLKTVGADASVPTTGYVRWDGTALTINYGSGAVSLTGVENWNIAIQNGLVPEFGKVTGNDTNVYPVAEQFDEGGFDCTVTISRFHRDETPLEKVLANTKNITLTIPFDGKVWTFSGGFCPKPQFPGHKRGKDPLKETLELKFNGISIA